MRGHLQRINEVQRRRCCVAIQTGETVIGTGKRLCCIDSSGGSLAGCCFDQAATAKMSNSLLIKRTSSLT